LLASAEPLEALFRSQMRSRWHAPFSLVQSANRNSRLPSTTRMRTPKARSSPLLTRNQKCSGWSPLIRRGREETSQRLRCRNFGGLRWASQIESFYMTHYQKCEFRWISMYIWGQRRLCIHNSSGNLIWVFVAAGCGWAQQADPCENLKSFKAASAEITKATLIPAGTTRRSPGDRAARRRFPHIASLRRDESPDGN